MEEENITVELKEEDKPKLKEEDKPFVLFKTKKELLAGDSESKWSLSSKANGVLNESGVELSDVFGAKMTVDSPTQVVEVKLVSNSPDDFFKLAFE